MRCWIFLAVILSMAGGQAGAAEKVSLDFHGLKANAMLEVASGQGLNDVVVLMLHGARAHAGQELLTQQQAELKAKGINSLAITLTLGENDREGMYSCENIHKYAPLDAVDEVTAWMDWLEQKGVRRIVLFGHSQGGMQMAVTAAEHDRESVVGVILVAPGTRDRAAVVAEYEKRYGLPLQPLLDKANKMVADGQGEAVLSGVDFLNCPKADVQARSFVAHYAEEKRLDAPSVIPEIKKPMLVVAAGQDQVVPDLEERMADVRADKLEFLVIDDADHLFLNFHGEELAELVAEFVGK